MELLLADRQLNVAFLLEHTATLPRSHVNAIRQPRSEAGIGSGKVLHTMSTRVTVYTLSSPPGALGAGCRPCHCPSMISCSPCTGSSPGNATIVQVPCPLGSPSTKLPSNLPIESRCHNCKSMSRIHAYPIKRIKSIGELLRTEIGYIELALTVRLQGSAIHFAFEALPIRGV